MSNGDKLAAEFETQLLIEDIEDMREKYDLDFMFDSILKETASLLRLATGDRNE